MRKAAISPPSKVLSEFYVKCRSYSVMRLVYIALVSRTGAVNSPSLIRRTVNGRTKPIRAVTVIFFGSFHKSAICSCIVGGLHFFIASYSERLELNPKPQAVKVESMQTKTIKLRIFLFYFSPTYFYRHYCTIKRRKKQYFAVKISLPRYPKLQIKKPTES